MRNRVFDPILLPSRDEMLAATLPIEVARPVRTAAGLRWVIWRHPSREAARNRESIARAVYARNYGAPDV